MYMFWVVLDGHRLGSSLAIRSGQKRAPMRKAVLATTAALALAGSVAAGASVIQQRVTSADVQSAIAHGATGYAPGGRIVSAPPDAQAGNLSR